MSNSNLTIVIPMAGRGSRFASAGYVDPKPLISVNGTPMIQLVIENLTPSIPHRFVFICQKEHIENYALEPRLKTWAPGAEIVQIDGVTDGAACTVLKAAALIDDGPLMIANSDQYVDHPIDRYLEAIGDLDGMIMTMTADDPKWSFVAVDDDGLVTRVAEKQPISSIATVGVYNFTSGTDFVVAAKEMISANLSVNGEFYVAPVYNLLIGRGAKIGVYSIGSVSNGMYGLGVPTDLELFLKLSVLSKVKR